MTKFQIVLAELLVTAMMITLVTAPLVVLALSPLPVLSPYTN